MSQLKFKLNLEPKRSSYPIQYKDKIFLIGSCFTENIGSKLSTHLFTVYENPHGILFNPVSVAQALQDCMEVKQYHISDLFFHNEVWNSWNHHSRFSGVTQQEALDKINISIQSGHAYLKSANHLVITLGSAWLYQLTTAAPLSQGQTVANNHKAPAQWFSKALLTPTDLLKLLNDLVLSLKQFNSKLKVIFTISPVRHLREGLIENNRSKAVLIQAVHDLIALHDQVDYFPAYEYVIDDLRDYRFYAEDLVHPNYAATQYVWEKLMETYFSEETQQIMKQVAELQLAIQHKPFFKASIAHQEFLHKALQKTNQLLDKYPFLPLQKHQSFFVSELANKA